ncbi:di-trans,poly-cis-decaprenylcistransferase [Archaeoglobales archaeon]|nr:MAG: di-trans,poly-cis-decaprenylcistransferase [Archaeoglobales archaeon]
MLKLFKFLRKLYEKKLENEVKNGNLPNHIMVVTDQNDFVENTKSFYRLIEWCRKFKIEELTICLHIYSKEETEKLISELSSNLKKYSLRIITKEKTIENGNGDLKLNFILGYGGRAEITDAVKEIAKSVREGKLLPDEIDENEIEKYLRIKNPPDLIVRAGEEIPDFLIWQSIYSELYFLDIEWSALRYVDFLRCLRGYQRRERRFGR